MTGTPDPYAAFRLNLEQQRKRAKDLVRAVRARDREALSRLHTATDGRLAADDVKLTDAQFVIARELGFASWRELRRHIDALTAARAAMGHTPPPDAQMPTLHVRCGSDIEQELLRARFHWRLPLALGSVHGRPRHLRCGLDRGARSLPRRRSD